MYCMFRLNFGFGLIVLCAFPFLVGIIGFCLWTDFGGRDFRVYRIREAV